MTNLGSQVLRHREKATVETPAKVAEVRPYESPKLLELGTLARLQAIGYNYRDGTRYKCNP